MRPWSGGVSGRLAFAAVMLWSASAARGELVLSDPTSPVYYTFALAAGERIELEAGAAIQGSIHSNGDIDLKTGSAVAVDASAAGRILGGGTVSGSRQEGADRIFLPALFDEASARARADRIFERDLTFDTLQTIDDVLFVDGNVRFRAGIAGIGTVIASGDIQLDNVNVGQPVEPDGSPLLSLVAFRDILFGKGRPLRGALRAGRDVVLDKEVSLQGVIAAGRKVWVRKDAALTFFNVDPAPPIVTPLAPGADEILAESAPEIRAGFSDDFSGINPATVRLFVDAEDRTAEAQVSAVGLSLRLPLSDGLHSVDLSIQDNSGRPGLAFWTFRVDTSSPELKIEVPRPGQISNQPTIRVAGEATDPNGVARVEVNGFPATLAGDLFLGEAALAEGANAVTVRAVDVAGNARVASVEVTWFKLPTVEITSPEDLGFLASTTVDVSGTVSDPAATVSVNGSPASVSGGTFTALDIPLIEGGNLLTAVATDSQGHVGTDTIQVVRDLTPPRVVVSYPKDGARVFEAAVAVSGMVNDIVAGTVNASEVAVTVNGRPAAVANRSFSVDGLALVPGPNVITVAAVDESGNEGRATITVRFDPSPTRRIRVVSGSRQSGVIGAELPQPLRVELIDASGAPVPGGTVLFKVVGSNGHLDNGQRQAGVVTGTDGRAEVRFTLGTRAGVDNQAVEALALGFAGSAVFTVTALPGQPAHILVDAGNQQTGVSGQALPRPLIATVTDSGFNRLPGIPVTFQVTGGQGSFGELGKEITVETDSDGRALATPILDPEEGIATNIVEARIAGLESSPKASFFATGRAAGPPALTSVSGVVLDNANVPVKGVTLRILDTDLTAVTDDQGQFRIAGAPPGLIKLIVDGSTAERPGSWPDLEFQLTNVPGRDNTVGMPIYLLPLDLQHGLYVDETRGGTLTLPEVPGFSLEIAPGSVTFPGGSRSGLISVTVVHGDKVPMVPNFGQQPRFIVTIQPAGARFEPPARLRLPNLEGLAPGHVTEMYSFDHDLGHFVSIGPATVSEDGMAIASNPGVGIVKAGWHCGGDPAAAGTTADCPDCTICNGSECVEGCTLTQGLVMDQDESIRGNFAASGRCLCKSDPNKVCNGKKCECAVPTNFHKTTGREDGPGFLYFEYKWESSTGKPEDLAGCKVGEVVYFPSNPFDWPAPWTFSSGSPAGGRPSEGPSQKITDLHGAYDPPPIVPPLKEASFITRQIYGFTCPCLGLPPDQLKLLPGGGPFIIHREVKRGPTGKWQVCITKSGLTSCGDLQ